MGENGGERERETENRGVKLLGWRWCAVDGKQKKGGSRLKSTIEIQDPYVKRRCSALVEGSGNSEIGTERDKMRRNEGEKKERDSISNNLASPCPFFYFPPGAVSPASSRRKAGKAAGKKGAGFIV